MHLSFGMYCITFQTWSSQNAMRDFLQGCNAGSLTLGDGAEYKTEFFTVVVYSDREIIREFGVGICSEGHGLRPHVLLHPTKPEVVFGFNSEIASVDAEQGRKRVGIKLDSLFRSFLILNKWGQILVFHEIGVVAIDYDGRELWQYSKDVITGYVIKDGRLFLDFMDTPPIQLCLSCGLMTCTGCHRPIADVRQGIGSDSGDTLLNSDKTCREGRGESGSEPKGKEEEGEKDGGK